MKIDELKIGQVYHGWKISYMGKFFCKCDICGRVRPTIIEFVHENTPIDDQYGKWNGFVHEDEPLRFGTECVKQFILQGLNK